MKHIILFIVSIASTDIVFCQTLQDKVKADSLKSIAWDASQKNYFKKCIRLIDSSILYDSTKSWSYIIKAEAHWLISEFKDAAISYKKAMTLDSEFVSIGANVLLGMLYDKAENFNQAKQQYSIAINLWENGYTAKHKLFQIQEEIDYIKAIGLMGDSIKMINKLTTFIQKNPDQQSLACIAEKSRLELLEFNFKSQYRLPDNIQAKEE